jgi:hypothetical protein
MKKFLILCLFTSVLLLSGCFNLPENSSKINIKLNNKDYVLEKARNQEERERGLMNRQKLPENEGMIFYFDQSDYQSFWMKNTLIPLEIIFVNGCKIVDTQTMSVEKDPNNPLKTYTSKQKADKAIEINPISSNLIGSEITELCD